MLEQFLQQLANGLILGSVYALLALGYTMVYGIIKLINFAHGDIYMIGAFMGYYLINTLHLNFFSLSSFAQFNTDCSLDHSNWGFFPLGVRDGLLCRCQYSLLPSSD